MDVLLLVIARLGKCVTMPDKIKLYIEPYNSSKSQGAMLDGSDVNTSRNHTDSESIIRGSSPILFNRRNEESEEDHQLKTSSSGTANLSRNSSNSSIKSSSSHSSERSNTSMKSTNSLNDCPEMLNLSASSSSSSSHSKTGIDVAVASESVSWSKSTREIRNEPFGSNTRNTVFGNKTNSNSNIGVAGKRSNTFSAKRNSTPVYDRTNAFSGKMSRSKSEARTQEGDSNVLIHGHGNSWLKHGKQLWKSQGLATGEDYYTLAEQKGDSDREKDLMECPADTLFPSSDEDDTLARRSSYSADMKTKKLSFSIEKLKLLQLVHQSKGRRNTTNGCRVTFDEKSKTVTMEGSFDDLVTMELHLHEIALQSTTNQLDIPKSSQKLLLSKRGGEWLAREFSQRHLLAVFYVFEGRAHIAASDDTTLESASDLLDKILTTQKLPFDESVKSYLQSTTWAGKVEEAESSGLVSIDTDYSQKFILITGSATDVSSCISEVRKILNMNTSTTRSIKHKIGVVRLLMSQSHEMTAKVNTSTGYFSLLNFSTLIVSDC